MLKHENLYVVEGGGVAAMPNLTDRRKYQRCSDIISRIQVSTDGKKWHDIEMSDISADGVRFVSECPFNENERLHFYITIYSMLSEFNFLLAGYIVRVEALDDGNAYAAKFDKADAHTRIQLDELIKSRMINNSPMHAAHEDGVYTFLLPHRVRPSRRRFLK